jgi:hypothetical protein
MRFVPVQSAVVGMALVLASVSARAEEPQTVASALQARHQERWPVLGVSTDVGLPDGAIASLVVRPWQWFRAYAGGGSNSISKGWRGGFSLVPFGAGPSVSLEYGQYGEGDANGLVRRMVSGSFKGSALLDRVGYDYANAQAGLDFGGKNVLFFVHGGVSMVWAQVHNLNEATSNSNSSTTVSVSQDPKVKAFGSSLKVGLIVFMM